MEPNIFNGETLDLLPVPASNAAQQSAPRFIEANTVSTSLDDIRKKQIIPTFKDSEPLISHSDFIEATADIVRDFYYGETVLLPAIRQSHPIQGRVPEAKDKPTHLLTEKDRTLYFERMAFVIEIPSIQSDIGGNTLSLTVGGVKAYNLDNLYNRKGADEHFKVFVGFQNKVCTNMCVWSDGYIGDLKVKSLTQLRAAIYSMLANYQPNQHLNTMRVLQDYHLSEQQFAMLIGRCRMYQHLPSTKKQGIPQLLFGDQQLGAVCKDYYRDKSFCRDADGSINLWKMYNLFTGANKSSYIDSFLDRSVNAFDFTQQVRHGLDGRATSWYLN